jgi:hypothetical protein
MMLQRASKRSAPQLLHAPRRLGLREKQLRVIEEGELCGRV